MIEASCHCGAIKFSAPTAPEKVNACNCSICRRYGTLWAYYAPRDVHFAADNGPTDIYMWGDRELEFHRCHTCGCVTHWAALDKSYERMGVNARLMATEVVEAAEMYRGDGAAM
ncbi:MAG: GFA family protein [Terricaulis sp.]